MHSPSPLYEQHAPPIFILLDMLTQYYMVTATLREASHYVIFSSLLLLPLRSLIEHPQPTFLLQCDKPSFTPTQYIRQNCSFIYFICFNIYISGQQTGRQYSGSNGDGHSPALICPLSLSLSDIWKLPHFQRIEACYPSHCDFVLHSFEEALTSARYSQRVTLKPTYVTLYWRLIQLLHLIHGTYVSSQQIHVISIDQ
jgi:hypothetical protein